MESYLKKSIWQQFGASIDFLAHNINVCPDDLWEASLWKTPDTTPEFSQFWYVAYHTLFWLDLYLTGSAEGFQQPSQFKLDDCDIEAVPERVYQKEELQAYLKDCREKCRAIIDHLTEERAQEICRFRWGECSFFELLIYNQRHVHGHASQLNMLLGQHIDPQRSYVTQARD